MLLVLPIAGNSTRFPGVKPKWMLRHPQGEIMLAAGLRGMPDFIHNQVSDIVVIMLGKHLQMYPYAHNLIEGSLRHFGRTVHVYGIPETRSEAETVMHGLEHYVQQGHDVKQPLLIKDCDNYYRLPGLPEGLNTVLYGDLVANPGVTAQDKSYVALATNSQVETIVEKRVISEHFCVSYGFESVQRFLDLAHSIPECFWEDTQHPVYLSDVIYNALLMNVHFTGVRVGGYRDWGTAEKWRAYTTRFSTVFIDLDGVLWNNMAPDAPPYWQQDPTPLNDNVQFLLELQQHGDCYIVFTTSRPETLRELTKGQLLQLGLQTQRLIMGLPHAPRFLVNDSSDQNRTAVGYTVQRDWDGQLRALLEPVLLGGDKCP